MSGGVDSAVAAARAVEAGHDVTGVHLALSRMPGLFRSGSRGCCTIEDSLDARRAAGLLGIPFYVWDFSEQFTEAVVDDFIAEYSAGRTPNPCMRCNERIKFAALLDRALELGFDAVATGHYANVEWAADGTPELHRASAWAKDQSYVLGVLTTDQLRHAMFPLGDTPSKDLVRAEAERRGLSVANKPDSHDICFIPEGDTRDWLAERIPMEPGDIVDTDGTVLGHHDGALAYTVGQRKGLNLGVPAADGRPRFVVTVKPSTNEVVVGGRDELDIAEIAGARFSWAGNDPVTSEIATETDNGFTAFDCEVQIRAHADPVPAIAEKVDGEIVVRPSIPLNGVATGQTAVLYVGTRVLGQFTIDRTVSVTALV
ncbi:MAG: tRNA 2-thiouridine(34) synthase MnmA [Actinomycetota bacterium]